MLAGAAVIVRHQHLERVQPGEILRCPASAQAEGQFHSEFRPLALPAFYRDAATHQRNKVFGNGHTESRAPEGCGGGGRGLFKGTVQTAEESPAHADARIADNEAEADGIVLFVELMNFQPDSPAGRSELDCVGENVEQNLIETQDIPAQFLLIDFGQGYFKILLPLLRLRLDKIDHGLNGHPEIERLVRDEQFAALNLGHVEHVVDEAEQMARRLGYFAQTVLHSGRIVQPAHGNGGHADNGVHGRADFVRHMREKIALRGIGLARAFQGVAQCPLVGDGVGLVGQYRNMAFQSTVLVNGINPDFELPSVHGKGDVPFNRAAQASVVENGPQPVSYLARQQGIQGIVVPVQLISIQAEDASTVGADVFKLFFAAGNQKNFVYVFGQQVEQLFPIGDFPVFLALKPVRENNQPDEQPTHQQGNQNGEDSCPVHIGQNRRASAIGGLAETVQHAVQRFQIRKQLTPVVCIGLIKCCDSGDFPDRPSPDLPELMQHPFQSVQILLFTQIDRLDPRDGIILRLLLTAQYFFELRGTQARRGEQGGQGVPHLVDAGFHLPGFARNQIWVLIKSRC